MSRQIASITSLGKRQATNVIDLVSVLRGESSRSRKASPRRKKAGLVKAVNPQAKESGVFCKLQFTGATTGHVSGEIAKYGKHFHPLPRDHRLRDRKVSDFVG